MGDNSDTDMVPVGTKLPPDVKRAVRIAAAHEGKTMSSWLRDAALYRLDHTDLDDELPEDLGL
jgi:uncharacterized protein (DUF1778 family)